MAVDLQTRVEALRRPLLFAAEDGFRGLERVRDLGATLRAAVDRLAQVAPPERRGPLAAWRKQLARFETLDRDEQSIEIARGLRLCQVMGGAVTRGVTALREDDARKAQQKRQQRSGAPPEVAPVLERPVTSLAGIGPALAERLAERGIETVEDLVWLVPRRYDDARRVTPLAEAVAADGERVTTAGTVARCRFNRGRRMRWVELQLADGDARLVIRWFNAHGGMTRRFPTGSRAVVSGPVRQRAGAAEMANPDVIEVTTPDGHTRGADARIIPRYPAIPGVPPATLRKACRAAVELGAASVIDGVPPAVAGALGLPPLGEALGKLHDPPGDLDVELVGALDAGDSEWHRRLAFDELFFLGLAVARRRAARRAGQAVPCPVPAARDAALARAVPFAPTGAQVRAIDAIAGDLARDVPMNRLLQGDVGSGKTAVAFAAAHQVIAAGRQVAIMAPTEILAEQHAAALAPWCEALGIRCALLTASTPRGARQSLLSLLAAGEIQLAIGTHALIADGVVFDRLGLAVIDEQHRFGVAQRVRLRSKGDDAGSPHLLVMTATPIPRTLALTAYGDLDVTVIDELPPGRMPPVTKVMSGKRGRESTYKAVARAVGKGARVFVVCPLVEPSDDPEAGRDWASATAVAAELSDTLAPARVGLVHGRMTQPERDEAMGAFRDGALDVLVATTVIEVGVDVPEATVMVVEDADRFGLAQLHQLRGRVGRGGGDSHCLLLTRGGRTASGNERLSVMAETCDGFRIAEEDLRIRGPGELLGARQAGLPKLRFGDLQRHVELLTQARAEAEALLGADPELARHPVTRRVLEQRTKDAPVYGAEGG